MWKQGVVVYGSAVSSTSLLGFSKEFKVVAKP